MKKVLSCNPENFIKKGGMMEVKKYSFSEDNHTIEYQIEIKDDKLILRLINMI